MSFFTRPLFRVLFGLFLVAYGFLCAKGKGGGFFGKQLTPMQNTIIGSVFAAIGTILVIMGVIYS